MKGKIKCFNGMGVIYLVLLVALTISLVIQICFFKTDTAFYSSLNTNIMATIIGILMTVAVINKLLVIHEEKENTRILTDILGTQYKDFVCRISNVFLQFVLKQEPMMAVENKKNMDYTTLEIPEFIELTNRVIKDIDFYIDNDFIKKPIIIKELSPDREKIIKVTDIPINYFIFCEHYFKNSIESEIEGFQGRYITIIPTEIRKHIFIISDLLKSGLFNTNLITVMNTEGIPIELDIEAMKQVLKNLGMELLALQKYCS